MNQMKKYIYVLVGSTLLTACKVGENYKQTEVELPSQYSVTEVEDKVNEMNQLSWKEFFNHEELSQLIEVALQQNTDLQLAVKNLEQMELLYKQSKLALLPELTLNAAASRMESSKNSQVGLSGAKRTNDDFNAHLGLNWELDIWGKIRRQKEASLASYLQQKEVKRAISNRIVVEVANIYINILMLDEQLDIAKQSVTLRENTYLLTKKMFEVGNETILAVQQSEAQWLEARELLPMIEQEVALQESALNVLLNDYPKVINRTAKLNDLVFKTDLSTGVPANFLSSRPDIQVAEYGVIIANAKMGVAKGEMYPSLTISAQGGLNSIEASDWMKTPASLFGTLAGNIIQPIFNQKKLRTAYEIAKVEREKAVIDFRSTVIIGFTEVYNALVKINKIQEKESLMNSRVAILNTSLDNTKFMFEMDKASYLEVINAQSLALQGNLNYIELKRDYLASLVELYRSLGGN